MKDVETKPLTDEEIKIILDKSIKEIYGEDGIDVGHKGEYSHYLMFAQGGGTVPDKSYKDWSGEMVLSYEDWLKKHYP